MSKRRHNKISSVEIKNSYNAQLYEIFAFNNILVLLKILLMAKHLTCACIEQIFQFLRLAAAAIPAAISPTAVAVMPIPMTPSADLHTENQIL